MRNAIGKYVFRRNNGGVPPNLFIGGVSDTINTPALLAAKFTFLEEDVTNFSIDGLNISAGIDNINYDFIGSAFRETPITSISETSGYLKSGHATFHTCTSLTYVNLTGLTYMTREFFYQCANLHVGDIHLPEVITANNINSSFHGVNVSLGETLSLPKATYITGSNAFRFFRFTIDAPLCTTFGTGDTCAFGNGILNIPSVTSLGASVADETIFRLCSSGLVINVNDLQQTINGGNPDGDLAYALSRGATVNYIP